MAESLDGRRIVVTGGTGFLGSAVVKALVALGATCDVTWMEEHELKHHVAHERIQLHQVDCVSESQVTQFYAQLPALWASVHTIGGFTMGAVDKTSADEMKRMFELNAVTCFLCCREAIKTMRRAGGGGGRIVNVAARPAVVPTGGMTAYSASKAAVASITQSVAEDVKAEGILVNAVLPSIMDTAANRRAMPNADFAKWPKVEQVAQAIAFLAGPQNALTSGALLPVYGQS